VPWSRLRGQPPGLKRLPRDDQPPRPMPLLTQPFAGGMTAWVVIFGTVIAELIGGAVVGNQASAAIAVPVLIAPVVVAYGFAVVQWWQVRSSGAEPPSWWHLGGIAAAVITWLVWPTVPAAIQGTGVLGGMPKGHGFCYILPNPAPCLHRAAQAADDHYLAFWCTGAVIVLTALLTRRSRIAAYAALPAALAGGQLSAFFLTQFVLYYHLVLSVAPREVPGRLIGCCQCLVSCSCLAAATGADRPAPSSRGVGASAGRPPTSYEEAD